MMCGSTAGEITVGGKKVLFMDEISTGLDSATTFLITKCLSNFCHIMEGTLLVALLQPAPETYNLFDDVMLLSQGRIVFHGPREEVRRLRALAVAASHGTATPLPAPFPPPPHVAPCRAGQTKVEMLLYNIYFTGIPADCWPGTY